MGIHENKATVERFDELTGAAELDALDEICTADMVNHALASHRPAGLAGTKQFLAESQDDAGHAAWRRSMIFEQRVVTVAEGDYVIHLESARGHGRAATSAESTSPPATTSTTSRSCTAYATGESPSAGPCAMTSA